MYFIETYIKHWNKNINRLSILYNVPYQQIEDNVSLLFEKYIRQNKKFENQTHFMHSLKVSVKNMIVDEKRKSIQFILTSDFNNFLNIYDNKIDSKEYLKSLKDKIKKLPKKQRKTTLLRAYGLTYKEISNYTNSSLTSVKSNLFWAKESLKNM